MLQFSMLMFMSSFIALCSFAADLESLLIQENHEKLKFDWFLYLCILNLL